MIAAFRRSERFARGGVPDGEAVPRERSGRPPGGAKGRDDDRGGSLAKLLVPSMALVRMSRRSRPRSGQAPRRTAPLSCSLRRQPESAARQARMGAERAKRRMKATPVAATAAAAARLVQPQSATTTARRRPRWRRQRRASRSASWARPRARTSVRIWPGTASTARKTRQPRRLRPDDPDQPFWKRPRFSPPRSGAWWASMATRIRPCRRGSSARHAASTVARAPRGREVREAAPQGPGAGQAAKAQERASSGSSLLPRGLAWPPRQASTSQSSAARCPGPCERGSSAVSMAGPGRPGGAGGAGRYALP